MTAPRDVVVVLLDSLNRHLRGHEGEVRNQAGGDADKEMAELLVEAMRSIEATAEQLVRLGLG